MTTIVQPWDRSNCVSWHPS